MKYYKCTKCGTLGWNEGEETPMCMEPMPVRVSNICGGSYMEISKKEFDKLNAKQDLEL